MAMTTMVMTTKVETGPSRILITMVSATRYMTRKKMTRNPKMRTI